MSVTQLPATVCPPTPTSSCSGEYIRDARGCVRQICPSTSQLCHVRIKKRKPSKCSIVLTVRI